VNGELFSGFCLSEGGVLFVTTGNNERHLWFSDGNPEGTRSLNVNGELFSGFCLSEGGVLFVTTGNNERHLWFSDEGGSAMKVEGPEPGGVVASGLGGMASAGDWLYVISENQVLAINEGGQPLVLLGPDEQPFNASSCGMEGTGDQLYLTCSQGSAAGSWRVDAGESTARKISSNYSFNNFRSVGALTFFSGYLPASGRDLWVTDGTESGTFLFSTPNPDPAGSNPTNFRVKGNALFVRATDGVANKIWKFSVVGKTVSLSGPVGSGVESG
jgi:ELWxxDGT repeat protein